MAKTRKRGLALLMAVVLALSLLPVSALASGEEEVVHDALTLAVDDEQELVPTVDVETVSGRWYVQEGKEDVVSVDEDGVIRAMSEGTANVYFEYTENEPVTLEEQPAVVIPETPAVDQPAVDQPAVDQPAVDQPAVDQPAVDQPAVDQPAVDQPAVDQPAVDQPAVDQPAVDQPAVNEIMPLISTQYSAGETKVEVFPIEVVDLSDGETVLVGDSLRLSSSYFGKAWDQKKVLEVVIVDTSGQEISRETYDVFTTAGSIILGTTDYYVDVTVLPQRGYKIVSSEPEMDSDHNVRFVYDKLTNHIGGEEKRTLTVTVEKNTAEAYNVTFVWNVDSLLGGDFSDVVYREVTVSAQDACLGADMPAAPVYYNQAFEGWNTHRDGKGIEVTANTPITQDMTLYGQWSTAEIISEYHVMGLTSIKRVVKDNAGLDTLDFAIKSIQATDGENYTTTDISNKYMEEWDCWNVHNDLKPVRPEEIKGLAVTIEVSGEEQVVEIPASQFASITRYGYYAEIELEVPAYDEAVVTFWYQPGAGILWEEYATRTVKVGESLGENMPADPTYPGSTYKFQVWNTEKEFGTEFKADTVVNGDMNVYARKALYDAGSSQYHVMGDEAIYEKVAAAYLKEHPDADITADDVDISKMSMVGENGATNKDYWGVVNANEWCDYDGVENYYYYIHNVDALDVGFGSNTRVPVDEIVGLKLWCTVGGQPYEYQVPRANLDLTQKGDAIVEVRVKLDQYTVTFMDGTDVYATQTVSEGNMAVRPADPTKTGMEFQGWTLEDGTAFDFQTRIYENVVLYAQWKSAEPGKQTITLRYDANGADVTNLPAAEEQTVEAGKNAAFTVTTQKPERKGYTFLGWAENSAAETAQYKGGESLTVSSDKVLYAVWKSTEPGKQTITLRYDANGADVTNLPAAEEQTVEAGKNAAFTVTTQKPERKGYTFLGWAENSAAETAQYKGGESLTVSSDKVLYAVWKDDSQQPGEIIELSFQYVTDVHGASAVPGEATAPETVELERGSVFGQHDYGTGGFNSRYTFHGWFADPACNVPMEEDTVLTQDTVVYGYWTRSGGSGGGDGDGGSTDVPDENVPTTDLPDVDVPTTDVPGGDTGDQGTDLGDGDVPLAEVPKTGDSSALWVLAAAISGIGLVWLTICKKRETER